MWTLHLPHFIEMSKTLVTQLIDTHTHAIFPSVIVDLIANYYFKKKRDYVYVIINVTKHFREENTYAVVSIWKTKKKAVNELNLFIKTGDQGFQGDAWVNKIQLNDCAAMVYNEDHVVIHSSDI